MPLSGIASNRPTPREMAGALRKIIKTALCGIIKAAPCGRMWPGVVMPPRDAAIPGGALQAGTRVLAKDAGTANVSFDHCNL